MFPFNIMQKMIQKINNLFLQKKLLDSLTSGDLVWAKMPLSRKERTKIEKSHQIRPYLVVSKDKLHIYAYPCSSKQSNRLNNYQEYSINQLRYKRNRDSSINLTKLYKLPFPYLKSFFLTLNLFDLKNIQKRLLILSQKEKSPIPNFNIPVTILEGDVISICYQLYYVYASDNVYLYCFSIFKKCPKDIKKYTNIIINNKTYYTTFKEKVSFEKTMKMSIINIAYQNEIKTILEKKQGIENKQKSLSNIEKKSLTDKQQLTYECGTIFQLGKKKIIYLFKHKNIHYGADLLLYPITKKIIPIHEIDKRQIINILPLYESIKVVEFLYLNYVQPYKEIKNLYQDLRTVVFY